MSMMKLSAARFLSAALRVSVESSPVAEVIDVNSIISKPMVVNTLDGTLVVDKPVYCSALNYEPLDDNVIVSRPLGVRPLGFEPLGVGPLVVGPLVFEPLGVGPLVVGPLGVGPLGVRPLGFEPLGVGPLGVGPLGCKSVAREQLSTWVDSTAYTTNYIVNHPVQQSSVSLSCSIAEYLSVEPTSQPVIGSEERLGVCHIKHFPIFNELEKFCIAE